MSRFPVFALPLLLLLPACTHISGNVEQAPGKPLATAVLSIGRPGGIAVYGTHHVDAKGHFDFLLGPTDETNVYVYDGAADPQLTLRHLDLDELSTHMLIQMSPANPNVDLAPGGP